MTEKPQKNILVSSENFELIRGAVDGERIDFATLASELELSVDDIAVSIAEVAVTYEHGDLESLLRSFDTSKQEIVQSLIQRNEYQLAKELLNRFPASLRSYESKIAALPSDNVGHLPNAPGTTTDTMTDVAPSSIDIAIGNEEGDAFPTATLIPESAYPDRVSLPLSSIRHFSREKTQDADYILGELIGQGALAVVMRAVQVSLDRNVVVKIFREPNDSRSTVARKSVFSKEASIIARLTHPNIVPVYDAGIIAGGEFDDQPFYAMRELVGTSWRERINHMTLAENLDVFLSVSAGISYAHSKKIVHCDIKPDNVQLGDFGEVFILDWGLAFDTTDPSTFHVGGTLEYCSPEMALLFDQPKMKGAHRKPEVGVLSDVYLMGGTLFQIITGLPPRRRRKDPRSNFSIEVQRAIRNEINVPPEHKNDELMQIALSALRISNEHQINSIDDMVHLVKSYRMVHSV